jgi:hypothetical protein
VWPGFVLVGGDPALTACRIGSKGPARPASAFVNMGERGFDNGSISGAVVEPLVRLGAEHLTLVEPDVYEHHNLNRQSALRGDIGRNNAQVLADRVRAIHPYLDDGAAVMALRAAAATATACRLVQEPFAYQEPASMPVSHAATRLPQTQRQVQTQAL